MKKLLAGLITVGAILVMALCLLPDLGQTGHPPEVDREVATIATGRVSEARLAEGSPASELSAAESAGKVVPAAPVESPSTAEAPDYGAVIRAQDLSPELLELIQDAFVEFTLGNLDQAAMVALDALEISDDYPAVQPMLYGVIGSSYENLGYTDMAIEQYRMALALYPEQSTSYDGLRRLDPEFAATHPELTRKPITRKGGSKPEAGKPLQD